MRPKARFFALTVLIFLNLSCATFTTYDQLTPILGKHVSWKNPRVFPTEIDSIQPTFSWKESTDPTASYDIIVWEVLRTTPDRYGYFERIRGKEVYYRENLKEPRHTVEIPLQPNHEYYWSIRTRKGSEASPWSTCNYTGVTLGAYVHNTNIYFLIKTPKL